jgi:hypothetical protein
MDNIWASGHYPDLDPHYPDGLSGEAIEALLCEARVYWNPPLVTSSLLDGSAALRRERRMARRANGAVVRSLPIRPGGVAPDSEVA